MQFWSLGRKSGLEQSLGEVKMDGFFSFPVRKTTRLAKSPSDGPWPLNGGQSEPRVCLIF